MNQKIKILHLEDYPPDAELAEHELRKSQLEFEKKVVDNEEAYEKMLRDFNPDVILADHSLPSFDSSMALALLKDKQLDIPFILLTASVSEEFAVGILRQGAADYILKGRMQRLPSAVINSIRKRRLEDDRKELERQKDNFISMASHELKTPVTTLKAYAHLAETMLLEKGEVHTLDIIKRMETQVDKLTTLIENLLDFTKIQKGKLMYNEALFEFDELVKEVVYEMQKTNTTHTINYAPGAPVSIYGDRSKVAQVLTNLISNAIKYSRNADNIVVNSTLKEHGVELSVRDYGIGIAKQNYRNIFQQFYRVTGAKQSTFPGMGIGLFISSEIVARHGGRIWVESEVGQGATFFISLPFDHRLPNA